MKSIRKANILTLWMALLLMVTMVGCQHLPMHGKFPFIRARGQLVTEVAPVEKAYSISIEPSFRSNFPRRVVLVASGRNNGDYRANQKLMRELASQFRSAGLFEVVTAYDVRLFGHSDNILKGGFEEREVARIAREYNSDCLAIVRVNELRSHAPIRTDVTIAFVDANETITVCGIDGDWDLGSQTRFQEFEEYAIRSGIIGNNEIHKHSPNALFGYVAYDLANALKEVSF